MNKLWPWISKMLSEPDGTPSSGRLLFAIAVAACLAFCTGYWLKKGMDEKMVDLAKTVLYATGGNAAARKFAEGKKDGEEPAA